VLETVLIHLKIAINSNQITHEYGGLCGRVIYIARLTASKDSGFTVRVKNNREGFDLILTGQLSTNQSQ